MTKVKLRYVEARRDRNGRQTYWYFCRNRRAWKLPGQPLSEEFAAEYQRLLALTDRLAVPPVAAPLDKRSYPPGSFGALVRDYLGCARVKQLKPRTRAEYKRVLEALQLEHGDKRVALLRRRHIRKMRDARAETPGAANTVLRMLKVVLTFAVEEEWIEGNPARGMQELKGGEWRAWTEDECGAFAARWAPGTMQRRAYALAVYTGQRKSDLVAMARAHRRNGRIRVVQHKTGKELWIPEHHQLSDELGRGVVGHMSLLVTTRGKAFDEVYFGAWFADAIDEAKLSGDCVLHGLRKTAARRLAEAGCTPHEIMAITGHRTLRMVDAYTSAADQGRRASAAILKLERNKD